MNFTDTLKEEVVFQFNEAEYKANLSMCRDNGIQLTNITPELGEHFSFEGHELKELVVTVGKKVITLCNVDLYSESSGMAEYASVSNGFGIKEESSGVQVTFSDLASWFECRYVDIKEEIYKLVRGVTIFEGEMDIEGENCKIKLSNELHVEIINEVKESYEYGYRARVQFLFDKNFVTEEKALQLTKKIQLLFTVLVGRVINLENVILYDKGERAKNLYYLPVMGDTPEKSNSRRCLADNRMLINNGCFENIFKSYFSTDFPSYWSSLYGVLNYEGFWEYGYISVFTLLERYLDGRFPKRNTKTLKNDTVFKQDVLKVISNNGKFEQIIQAIKESRDRNKVNSVEVNFDNLFLQLPKLTVKYFSFSSDEFKALRKVRNAISHGSFEQVEEEFDLVTLEKIKNKTTLVLIYLVMIDMGLRDDEILRMFHLSLHSVVMNSSVNKRILDVEFNKALELTLKDSDHYDQMAKLPAYAVFDLSSEAYSFNKNLSQKAVGWLKQTTKSKKRNLDDYLSEFIDAGAVLTQHNQIFVDFPDKESIRLGCCFVHEI